MLQISKRGLVVSPSPESVERLGEVYRRQNCLLLPRFLEPGLLNFIQEKIHDQDFYPRSHGEIGRELCLIKNIAHSLLYFLLNNPKLFLVIQGITGCENIGSFEGRAYRIEPGLGHYDEWHNDMCDNRLVGMSINLSTEIFTGGRFQIKDHVSGQVIREIANTGQGDAIIFRISYDLQHRIEDINGVSPKTAFAGWFKSHPDFLSVLRGSDNTS